MGTDDLQDDVSYEGYVAEEGGFGSSDAYYKEDGYDYDASSPLTDVDYNPYDESSQYTSGGVGTDAYDPVARNNDDDEANNGNEGGRAPGYGGDVAAGDDDNFNDDWADIEDNYDGEYKTEKDNAEDGDDGDAVDEEDDEEMQTMVQSVVLGKSADYNGAIKWNPRQYLTLAFLNQVWPECRRIGKVRPLVNLVNAAVMQELNKSSPNLMLYLNHWVDKLVDSDADTLGSLLNLASKNGKRYVYLAISAAGMLFAPDPQKVHTLATFPSELEAAVNANSVKSKLNQILMVAIPMINSKYRR